MKSINLFGYLAMLPIGIIALALVVAVLVYPPIYVYRALVW